MCEYIGPDGTRREVEDCYTTNGVGDGAKY